MINLAGYNKQIGNRAGEVLLLSPDIFRDARLKSCNSIQSRYFGMLKVAPSSICNPLNKQYVYLHDNQVNIIQYGIVFAYIFIKKYHENAS